MDVSQPQIIGLALMAMVFLLAGWLAFRRQPRAIKLFALALAVIGLGYLATTPAPTEIARMVLGQKI
ncbi:MAG: hypothetical protein RLZ98_358 [Pseudomonadota bacterium]|jgi:hypothetical protein